MHEDANDTRRKRGRPKGKGAETRAKILTVARTVFSENGFERTTIRGIGERAGIDPSLVMQYFGTKEQLFIESIEAPPLMLSLHVVLSDIEAKPEWGLKIAKAILEPGEQAGVFEETKAIIRAAASRPEGVGNLRLLYEEYIVAGFIGSDLAYPHLRATMLAAVIIGVLFTNDIAALSAAELRNVPAPVRMQMLADIIQSILISNLDPSAHDTV